MMKQVGTLPFLMGLVTGFTVGLIIALWSPFRLETSIGLDGLISAISTLLVASYIGYYLQKRTDDRRIEKDILMRRIEDVTDEFTKVRGTLHRFKGGGCQLSDLNATLKIVSHAVHSLRRKLTTFEFLPALEADFKKVEAALDDYRHLIGENAVKADFHYDHPEERNKATAFVDALDSLTRSLNRL